MPRAVDAGEPCPSCGHASWQVDTRPEGTRVLACADCGFDEPYPNTFRIEKATGHETAADERRRREEQRDALLAVEVPVYAPAGASPALADVPSPSEVAVGAQLAAGMIVVHSRRRAPSDHEEMLARAALARTPGDLGPWPRERSQDGLAVWLLARARERAEQAACAAVATAFIRVDGEPRAFRIAGLGDCWVAARAHRDVTLVVTGEGLTPHEVGLERLADPAAALG